MKKIFNLSLFLILFFIGIDFATKTFILKLTEFPLEFYGPYEYLYPNYYLIRKINSFFNIFLVWNNGISFSMLSSLASHSQLVRWGLVAFASVIVLYLIHLLKKEKNGVTKFSYILIIAGAIGNIIDRIRYGAVIDFLDFHIEIRHWPAFNMADVLICVGVFLLIFHSIFFHKKAV